MPFEAGNQEAKKANHKRPRIIKQKLIARLQDAEGKELDAIITAMIAKAKDGDVPAAKEIFDRVDGKVATPIENGDEGALEIIHRIERIIVDPQNRDA